jgi:hypothetical protein
VLLQGFGHNSKPSQHHLILALVWSYEFRLHPKCGNVPGGNTRPLAVVAVAGGAAEVVAVAVTVAVVVTVVVAVPISGG